MRLIQIRRLTELGIPLARVPDVREEPQLFEEDLAEADAELALTIAQLQKARKERAKLR
ncbi:hypothetical protein ACFZB5_34055 [Streptomyces nodosus]|uniref:hypothetical protein n=1 Tax=Streptomyces nodosus TaxID=40318 RepID=UPI0036E5085D